MRAARQINTAHEDSLTEEIMARIIDAELAEERDERDAAIRQRDRLREACKILRSLYPQSNGKGWDDMDTALAACEKEAE